MRREIRLAGFGGQGIILSGYIIGRAVTIYDGKNATLTQSYGPEARGGACCADVVTSDGKIEYPKVTSPNVLIMMSQEAYRCYSGKENALKLIDTDLVKVERDKKVYSIPATRVSEELGKKLLANMVMLGFFTAITGEVSYEAMKQSILTSTPKGTEELNMTAFNRGYEYGRKTSEKKIC